MCDLIPVRPREPVQQSNLQIQKTGNRAISIIRNKWLQAGIAGIPFVGGPIQAYLSAVVQEIDSRNWVLYWESVEARLEELEEIKINTDYFSSEDFIRRLRRIHAEVTSGLDDTKMAYLRDYFVACASTLAVDVTWKDLVLAHLHEMTGSHLLVLRAFYDRQHRLSYKDRFALPQRTSASPMTLDDLCETLNPRIIDSSLLEMLVSDLCARGLVALWVGEPPEPKGWSISDAGLKFMHFLLDLWH